MPSPIPFRRRLRLPLAAAALALTAGVAVAVDPPALLLERNPRFELRASSPTALRTAGQQLLFACDHLDTFLDTRPPLLSLVVVDSAAQAGAADLEAARRASRWAAVYVGPAAPWERARGARSRTAPGADTLYSPGHAAAHLAFAAYCAQYRTRAGQTAPPEAPAAAAPKPPAGWPAGATGPAAPRHPGVPGVPQWFTEGVACFAEPMAAQNLRLAWLRANRGRHIPFARFLEMPAPAAGGTEDAMFSAQSLSFVMFIAAREGVPFLGRVNRGLLEGKPFGAILTDSKTLFARPDALEKDWLEWLEASAPR